MAAELPPTEFTSVEIQACPECHSTEMTNLLIGDENGDVQRMFIRCRHCDNLLAWCDLTGFSLAGHAFENYLARRDDLDINSGRQWLTRYRARQTEAEANYQQALAELRADNVPLDPLSPELTATPTPADPTSL